jgi:hypothetical protein
MREVIGYVVLIVVILFILAQRTEYTVCRAVNEQGTSVCQQVGRWVWEPIP